MLMVAGRVLLEVADVMLLRMSMWRLAAVKLL
jgi:hypothetical protein